MAKPRAPKEYNQYKLIRVRHPAGDRDTTISLQFDIYCLAVLALGGEKHVDTYIQSVANALQGTEKNENFSGLVSDKLQNKIEDIRAQRRAEKLAALKPAMVQSLA